MIVFLLSSLLVCQATVTVFCYDCLPPVFSPCFPSSCYLSCRLKSSQSESSCIPVSLLSCCSYFLHLAWQYGQYQYTRTIIERTKRPLGMKIAESTEVTLSSLL